MGSAIPLRRNGPFLLLWSGQSVSLVGSQVTAVALPLVAVVALGAGPWEMGVLAACGRLPQLLLGLPAGAWVDRLPRRPVLVVCSAAQAATLGLVPLAAGLGWLTLPLLAAVAFATGSLAVFADTAALALVPAVVPRARLTAAQGALETSQSVSQIAGPALSGWLVHALSAPLALLADAASFLVAAATAARVRAPERRHRDGTGLWRQVVVGARAVFGAKVLRYVTLCTATHVFFYNAFTAVLVLYLTKDLGMPPPVLGLVLSTGAVGGLVGSVVAARLGRGFGMGRTMAAAVVLAGVGTGLFAVAGGPVAVGAAQVLMWFALQVYNVLQVPVRYLLTPEAVHGRVNATIRTAVWGTAPAGALVGGALGDLVGLRATVVAAGVGAALASLWLVLGRVTAVRQLQ